MFDYMLDLGQTVTELIFHDREANPLVKIQYNVPQELIFISRE
jgi:hypothetical protein